MASVTYPQVQVFQEFNLLPTEITEPLRAFDFGPEFELHKYATGSAANVTLGNYDASNDVAVAWTDDGTYTANMKMTNPGSIVDLGYTKVFVENALLMYYHSAAAGVATNSSSYSSVTNIHDVTAYKNEVTLGINIKANGVSYPLNAVFAGRDVQAGDSARIVAKLLSGTTYTTNATITGVKDTAVASIISAATGDTNNSGNLVAGRSVLSGSQPAGGVTIDSTYSTYTYDGLADGVPVETYTIEVLTTTATADASLTTLRITSASGTDDVPAYVSTVSGLVGIPIGTRGFKAKFLNSGSQVFIQGQVFIVQVTQALTAPTATSNSNTTGTYTGTTTTTYVLTVIEGGNVGSTATPVISVMTTNGYDSGPSVSIVAASTPYPVGNFGATIEFSSLTLNKGSRYYVVCTAPAVGAYRTLVLDRSLPAAVLAQSVAPELEVYLFITKPVIELPSVRPDNNTLYNWTQGVDTFTMESGAVGYDSAWVNGNGSEVALPLYGGNVFVQYRALVLTHADDIYSIADPGSIASTFNTPNDPDNPLVYGLNKSLINNNGTSVRFMGVPTNDTAGYTAVLDKATTHEDVYFFCPLFSAEKTPAEIKTVQDLVEGHVNALSSPEKGKRRIVFTASPFQNPVPVLQLDGSSVLTATFSDDPNTTATDYTIVENTNDAFDTSLVKVGDVIRTTYHTDLNTGAEVFDAVYTIVEVISRSQLRIRRGPASGISSPVKIEIWRNLNAQAMAEKIALNSGVFASRRVYDFCPPKIMSGGVLVDGCFLAAAFAGLASGVVPHQGLTNLAIAGFDNADFTKQFNQDQLDTIASGGTWLVVQDPRTGAIYTRREVSTDPTDLNSVELMVTKNVDSISNVFQRNLAKYIGRTNVTPETLSILRTEVISTLDSLKTNSFVPSLGSQIIDAQIVELRQHLLLKDQVVIVLQLTIPYPVNVIECHLVI